MSTKTLTTADLHKLVDNWQLPSDEGDKLYPVNTVIEAYLKGRSDGKEETNILLKKQFQDNLNTAADHASKVVSFLQSKGFTPISAHLKVDSLYDFSIIITVSEQDFLKDGFTEIYAYTNHIEQFEKNELYSISFSFIDKSPDFNDELLKSDGYVFKLKELSQES